MEANDGLPTARCLVTAHNLCTRHHPATPSVILQTHMTTGVNTVDVGNNVPPSSNSRTLLHDLLAGGGIAGSAGIVIGHPFDSMKVRMQTTTRVATAAFSSAGGPLPMGSVPPTSMLTIGSSAAPPVQSLWAGIGAPLAMASVVNALIFLTYGSSSRMYVGRVLPKEE